jgi:hypothetical protein
VTHGASSGVDHAHLYDGAGAAAGEICSSSGSADGHAGRVSMTSWGWFTLTVSDACGRG